MKGGAVTVVEELMKKFCRLLPSLAYLSVLSLARRGGGEEGSSQTHLVLEEDTTLPPSLEERSLRRSLVKLGIRKSENRCAVSDRDGKSMLIFELCHAAGHLITNA
jgi:hypothetical protein